jgi:hypothetical protein
VRHTKGDAKDTSDMFDTVVQMAMQNYSRWARGEMDMQ